MAAQRDVRDPAARRPRLGRRRTSEAAARFADYLSRAETFASARPTDAIGFEALAGAHQRLGDVALAAGDAETAEREYLALQTNAEQLIGFDSANFRWREFVAVAWQRLGAVALARQDATTALADFDRYRSLSQALVAKDPANASARYDVANAEEKVGDALGALGRPRRSAAPPTGPTKTRWRRWSPPIPERDLAAQSGDQSPAARRSPGAGRRPRRGRRTIPRLSRCRRSCGGMGPTRPVAARRRPLLPARARGRPVIGGAQASLSSCCSYCCCCCCCRRCWWRAPARWLR